MPIQDFSGPVIAWTPGASAVAFVGANRTTTDLADRLILPEGKAFVLGEAGPALVDYPSILHLVMTKKSLRIVAKAWLEMCDGPQSEEEEAVLFLGGQLEKR